MTCDVSGGMLNITQPSPAVSYIMWVHSTVWGHHCATHFCCMLSYKLCCCIT